MERNKWLRREIVMKFEGECGNCEAHFDILFDFECKTQREGF